MLVSELVAKLDVDDSGFKRGIADADSRLDRFTRRSTTARVGLDTSGVERGAASIQSHFGSIQSAAQRTANIVSRVFIGFVAYQGIAAGFRVVGDAVVGFNSKLEQSSIAFTSLLGSAQKAGDFLQQLKTFAQTTPFQFPELVQASQRMLAYGFSALQIIPMLTAVGNATSALGGSQDVFNRISLALGQMLTKGVVQAEEMRQLAEAGIPAWQILATTLNVDVATAMDRVRDRAVSAGTFLNAFVTQTQSRFGTLMQQQSRTLAGAWSNIRDSTQILLSTAFKPAYDLLTGLTNRLADFLMTDRARQFADDFAAGLDRIIRRGQELWRFFRNFVGATSDTRRVNLLERLGFDQETATRVVDVVNLLGRAAGVAQHFVSNLIDVARGRIGLGDFLGGWTGEIGRLLGQAFEAVKPPLLRKLGEVRDGVVRWLTDPQRLRELETAWNTWGVPAVNWLGNKVVPALLGKLGEVKDAVWTWVSAPERLGELQIAWDTWGTPAVAWLHDRWETGVRPNLERLGSAVGAWIADPQRQRDLETAWTTWGVPAVAWLGDNVWHPVRDKLGELLGHVIEWARSPEVHQVLADAFKSWDTAITEGLTDFPTVDKALATWLQKNQEAMRAEGRNLGDSLKQGLVDSFTGAAGGESLPGQLGIAVHNWVVEEINRAFGIGLPTSGGGGRLPGIGPSLPHEEPAPPQEIPLPWAGGTPPLQGAIDAAGGAAQAAAGAAQAAASAAQQAWAGITGAASAGIGGLGAAGPGPAIGPFGPPAPYSTTQMPPAPYSTTQMPPVPGGSAIPLPPAVAMPAPVAAPASSLAARAAARAGFNPAWSQQWNNPVLGWMDLVQQVAAQTGIDPAELLTIIAIESSGRSNVTSPMNYTTNAAGQRVPIGAAQGLVQVLPSHFGFTVDPQTGAITPAQTAVALDPYRNLLAGAQYWQQFRGQGLTAAVGGYFAGDPRANPNAADVGGATVRDYLAKFQNLYPGYQAAATGYTPPSTFAPSAGLGAISYYNQGQGIANKDTLTLAGGKQVRADDICGPVLEQGFLAFFGRPPTISEAIQLAMSTGGFTGTEATGVYNVAGSLQKLGLPVEVAAGNAGFDVARQKLAQGLPVGFSSIDAYHYFLATKYNEATGQFYVGQTGLPGVGFTRGPLAGSKGGEWLTAQQIGNIQGAIYPTQSAEQFRAGLGALPDAAARVVPSLDRLTEAVYSLEAAIRGVIGPNALYAPTALGAGGGGTPTTPPVDAVDLLLGTGRQPQAGINPFRALAGEAASTLHDAVADGIDGALDDVSNRPGRAVNPFRRLGDQAGQRFRTGFTDQAGLGVILTGIVEDPDFMGGLDRTVRQPAQQFGNLFGDQAAQAAAETIANDLPQQLAERFDAKGFSPLGTLANLKQMYAGTGISDDQLYRWLAGIGRVPIDAANSPLGPPNAFYSAAAGGIVNLGPTGMSGYPSAGSVLAGVKGRDYGAGYFIGGTIGPGTGFAGGTPTTGGGLGGTPQGQVGPITVDRQTVNVTVMMDGRTISRETSAQQSLELSRTYAS